ncbi:MAG: aminodeoxychorismate synthase, component I [Cytophagaceae bacterium]|nr:aminodeoxychorismate synthase, component I [Cytophagaceae bacterium]
MMRSVKRYTFSNIQDCKRSLLTWAKQFEEVVWLDSNSYEGQTYPEFEGLLAVEAFTSIQTDSEGGFDRLEEYQQSTQDWIFGYLGYDLKNDTEKLSSNNEDHLGFSDLCFFQPKKLFLLYHDRIELHYLRMVDDEMDQDWKHISKIKSNNTDVTASTSQLAISLRIHKEAYKNKVRTLLDHIARGDIYEANLCQEFYAQGSIDPWATYTQLNAISRPPFATFLRLDQQYLLSASPERYIKKIGAKIVSQPIKGTAARGSDVLSDHAFAKALSEDPKERSENIMIVDLVRNDLSRTAKKGSVKVEELCKVYAFKQVHQMISTVVSEVDSQITPVDVLRTTFPMGSMTGAPKVRAMQLIEALEASKRGLYSGAVGYFDPKGDFDFNVIIRSILYNADKQYISYHVGGAITTASDPDKEYEECLLKARAMRSVLEGKS